MGNEMRAAIVLAGKTLEFYAQGGGDGGARARSVLEDDVGVELRWLRALEAVAEAAQAFRSALMDGMSGRLIVSASACDEYIAFDRALTALAELRGERDE